MECIYVDVLIILNIYVNYFLIRATSRFTHTGLKTIRCLVASLFGSMFSLMIFIPEINFFLNLAIKLIAAVFIVAIAFGIKDKRRLIKLIMYFYLMNFIFAGIMIALYILFQPSFIKMNNIYFYIDFSFIMLVVCTIIAYAAICLVRFIMDRSRIGKGKYTIIIKHSGRIISVDGISDTGNSLYDSFTGKSVIVCSKKNISGLLGGNFNYDFFSLNYTDIPKGFRLIPFSTISESGIIPVFNPDEIIIKEENSNTIKKVDALIGINSRDTGAIFNPELLNI